MQGAPLQIAPRKGGFTLIELLVVIAIIALLASMLLGGLSRAKQLAASIKCRSNVRQLTLGMQLYLNDHGYYPGYFTDKTSPWDYTLDVYLRQPKTNMVVLASDMSVLRPPAFWPGQEFISRGGVFTCPNYGKSPVERISATSYGYNTHGCPWSASPLGISLGLGHKGTFVPGSHNEVFTEQVKEGDVLVPSEMYAFGDSVFGSNQINRKGEKEMVFDIAIRQIARGSMQPSRYTAFILKKHQKKMSISYCDGHVEGPLLEKLFLDADDAALSRWNKDHDAHREIWEKTFSQP